MASLERALNKSIRKITEKEWEFLERMKESSGPTKKQKKLILQKLKDRDTQLNGNRR